MFQDLWGNPAGGPCCRLASLKGLTSNSSRSLLLRSRSPSSALLSPFLVGRGSPTKIDYRKKGTLILTTLLEDLFQIFAVGSEVEDASFGFEVEDAPNNCRHTQHMIRNRARAESWPKLFGCSSFGARGRFSLPEFIPLRKHAKV